MNLKANINSIGVWFICKSCQLTFPFRTVDEFLEHKAEKHFAEFQETQCVVFEEKEQSEEELFVTNTDEEVDTKLFPQSDGDVHVELPSGSGTSEIFSGTAAKPSSLLPLTAPVPFSVADPVLLPINRSHRDKARRVRGAASLKEKPGKESVLNANFGRLPSANTSSDPRPDLDLDLDLEADHVQRDTSSDSGDISSDPLSPDADFSFVDEEHANVEVQIHESDDSALDHTLKTPYALRRRRRLLPSQDSSFDNPADSCSNPKKPKMKTKKKKRKSNVSSSTLTSEESPGPFVCTICSRSFETKLGLNFHMNSHYGFNSEPHPFKCTHPDCRASFKNEKYLKRHTERHENASSNPRSFINKPFFKFPEPEPDDDTGPNQSDSMTFRDWLIEQKSSEKSNSSDPETVNIIRLDPDPAEMDETGAEAFKISGETPIKCKLCNKNLESVAQFKVHVTHCWLQNKLRHVYCLPCEKSLSNPLSLNKHSTRKHGKKKTKLNQFLCSLCPKMTKTESHLKRHMESHKSSEERVKPWVCEVCGLAYFDLCMLKYHQGIHGEETPFQCPHSDCARAFKSKVRLSSHLRNHIESKAYTCPKEGCSKSFKTKNELTKHLRTLQHTGVSRSTSQGNVPKKIGTDLTETNHFLFDT